MFEKFNDIIDAENLNVQQILDLYSDIIEMGDGDLISDTCYRICYWGNYSCGASSGYRINTGTKWESYGNTCYHSYSYVIYSAGMSYLNYNDSSWRWPFYCGSRNGIDVGTYWFHNDSCFITK